MKATLLYGLLLTSVASLLSWNSQVLGGPHGGTVKKSDNYFIEMKNNPDTVVFAYLLDKKLKAVHIKGVSAEVKFFTSDSTALDVKMDSISQDGFRSKVLPGFYSCKITFHVLGKDVSAIFEKQDQIVLTK